MVRMRIRRQIPERHVLLRCPLHLPAAHHSHAVTVQQQTHHHRGLIRGQPAPVPLVGPVDQPQIELLDHIGEEPRQVPLRQPIVQRRRQQQALIQVVGSEALAHTLSYDPTNPSSRHFVNEMFWRAAFDEIYLRQTPSLPPTETHHHITYKPEKDWWDKIKPFLEILAVLL